MEQQDQAFRPNKQNSLPCSGGAAQDEGVREVGGILAGVMNTVEEVIKETEGENRETRDKTIYGKLEGLKIQANNFKELAENSRGYKKREYEAFEKITKMQAGRLRLAFDIKPGEENTLQMLRVETK